MNKLINLINEFGATFLPKNKINFPLTLISSEIPLGSSRPESVTVTRRPGISYKETPSDKSKNLCLGSTSR